VPNTEPAIVTIYTDGACDPNPGPGGWAAILRSGGHQKEIYGGEADTTNNRMELRATIEALGVLTQPCRVELHTDSEYLRKGVTEWLPRWKANKWRTRRKRPVANQDLWRKLAAVTQPHTIRWHWVKGHAGHPLNERADSMARAAIVTADFSLPDTNAVHVFTGASCNGPRGSGGWAVMVRQGDEISTLSGQESKTTANRLQLLAAARALSTAKRGEHIHIYTHSDYVRRGASQWLPSWQRHNWKTRTGKPVKNRDLWKEIAAACAANEVSWHLARSSRHTQESEQAYELACDAASG
jgi:ribonuclease HI